MPRTCKPKPTDILEEVLNHFAGSARPMSQADADAIMRQSKKAIVERMLGGNDASPRLFAWRGEAGGDDQSPEWHQR